MHHLKTHTEETGHYGCDQCVKLFAHPDDLKRHSEIHSSTELTATDKAFNKVESEFFIEKKEEDYNILVDPEDYSDVSFCRYSIDMCIDLISLKDK